MRKALVRQHSERGLLMDYYTLSHTRCLISNKLSSEASKVRAQNLHHLQLANLFRWKI